MAPTPARWAPALALLALTTVFAAWLDGLWGGDEAVLWMENLVLTVVPLGVGVLAFRAARRAPSGLRGAWALLGTAIACWGVGSLIVTYVFSFQQADLPVADRTIAIPGPADLFFLAFFPLAIAGILKLPQGQFLAASKMRTGLDGLIIVLAVLFVAWAAGVGENIEGLGADALRTDLCAALGSTPCSLAGVVLGVLNPVGDLLLASVALFVAAFAPRIHRATLALLTLGFLSVTIADIDFSTRWLRQDNTLGNLLDAGWVLGFGMVGLAALQPTTQATASGSDRASTLSALVPYVPVGAAFVAAAIGQTQAGGPEPFLFWLGFILLGAVLARQAATVLANL